MTNPIIKIDNATTGESIEREMNEEELAQYQEITAKAQLELEINVKRAAAKAALLEKLGITEDEAKLLLS